MLVHLALTRAGSLRRHNGLMPVLVEGDKQRSNERLGTIFCMGLEMGLINTGGEWRFRTSDRLEAVVRTSISTTQIDRYGPL